MTQKELIEISSNRVYIEPNPAVIPGITHIGRLDFSSATQALEPHTHGDAFEFCYLERGIAVFQSGKQKWQINGGDCFISYPDEIHGTGSHPFERMKLFWIGYKPAETVSWLVGDCAKKEKEALTEGIGTDLPRIFNGSRIMGTAISSIIDAYITNNIFRGIKIRTSLLALFLSLAEKKGKPKIISGDVINVIDYINKTLNNTEPSGTDSLTLSSCAECAGLSVSRFKTRFKTETGIPPAEFITRKRIDKAAEMLKNGCTVTETSIECGFSSSQYFATVFRRYKNMSPSSWTNARK